jgi:glycerophosphoryl diester phosphodiesterase
MATRRCARACHNSAAQHHYIRSALVCRADDHNSKDPAVTLPLSSSLHQRLTLALGAVTLAMLVACGGGDGAAPFKTLDGAQPLVIAHRGASGYRPEETLEAYQLAIDMGADVIEPDLVLTQDGVLVARHDVTLGASTDVADHPEFAGRQRAGENGDGEAVAADWFVSDFTLAELKTLKARSPNHVEAKKYNDLYPIATFEEVLQLREAQSKAKGRTIAVYPETKNPTYHLLMTFGGKLPVRMEDEVLRLLNKYGLNAKDAPIFVQSFEPGSLQYMRASGSKARQVQLIDAYDVDFATGKMLYGTSAAEKVYSQATDWKLAGRSELFDYFLTPSGLAFVKTYADGIGPWKPMVVPVKCVLHSAGKCGYGYATAASLPATTLIADAHKAGLFVHEYTFRTDPGSSSYNLTTDMKGDPANEFLQHYRLGVDGVFTDQADVALSARVLYLKELGR